MQGYVLGKQICVNLNANEDCELIQGHNIMYIKVTKY
jgi:hypothetical protein